MSRIASTATRALTLLLLACGGAREQPQAGLRQPAVTRPAQPAGGAAPSSLVLVGVLPEPGSGGLRPSTVFQLEFDRPLSRTALESSAVRLEYVDTRLRFLVDPFDATVRSLSEQAEGRVLALDPPDLVPGERVRLTFGPGLQGADGALPVAAPDGQQLQLDFQVLELPW